MNVYSERDRSVGRRLGIRLGALPEDVTALGDGRGRIVADAKRELL